MVVLVAAAVTVSRWGTTETTGSVVGTLARTSHSAASGSQGPPPAAGWHDTPEAATHYIQGVSILPVNRGQRC